MKVFATRRISSNGIRMINEAGIELTEWLEKRDLTRDELIQYTRDHDALIVAGHAKIDKEFLEKCSHLKLIANHGVGYDHIDILEASRLKIPVANTPGILDKATADTAFLLMLAVSRKAIHNHKRILNGQWSFLDPTENLGQEIRGRTLGIFGLGNIGMEMARLCKVAYNMDIIYCNRSNASNAEKELGARKVGFKELLNRSDVLSVHSLLSTGTRGIFDFNAFKEMKASSIFINTARGAIHNEADLSAALQKGLIWGAGLDVTDPEPMDPLNPLLSMENTVILPHIGTATEETRQQMSILIAENLIAAAKGLSIPYLVNPDKT